MSPADVTGRSGGLGATARAAVHSSDGVHVDGRGLGSLPGDEGEAQQRERATHITSARGHPAFSSQFS